MHLGRAKQIVAADEHITVLHDGHPVWIQRLHEDDGTARIYREDEPEQEWTVSVHQLEEGE